jgi:hypothetical protein
VIFAIHVDIVANDLPELARGRGSFGSLHQGCKEADGKCSTNRITPEH